LIKLGACKQAKLVKKLISQIIVSLKADNVIQLCIYCLSIKSII